MDVNERAEGLDALRGLVRRVTELEAALRHLADVVDPFTPTGRTMADRAVAAEHARRAANRP